MTTYNNVLGVFSYAAHTLANTLWSERALGCLCDESGRIKDGCHVIQLCSLALIIVVVPK